MISDDGELLTQMCTLWAVQGKDKAVEQLQDVLRQAFEAAVRGQQQEYLRVMMEASKESYMKSEGMKVVREFLASGSGLFELPVAVSQMPPKETEALMSAWNLFTRMHAAKPVEGQAVLDKEIEIFADLWLRIRSILGE